MEKPEFERFLEGVCNVLRGEALAKAFQTSPQFEGRVRQVISDTYPDKSVPIIMNPPAQAFPDIAIGEFGVEVKFTENDTWRSVANSVQETNRVQSVKFVYLVFGKMGGSPDVKWGRYEECVMHVRTSHVPRFEVEIGASGSLFDKIGISYDDFRAADIHSKMTYIRAYARDRLKKTGEKLWWLEDAPGELHSLPIEARLYTSLDEEEKKRLRAQAVLLCPEILKSGRAKHKYDGVALFLLTYHGVLCHQARDLFSAGSVANPGNDDEGGLYIARALILLEGELRAAAMKMDAALFEEYWGQAVPPNLRIAAWLKRADYHAAPEWVPSLVLFKND